ncbi:hypothetical protein [Saccharothrix xinjiangensis]|uniref:hypothetical protein n=1 Tax=Saccharothrix xinjiangensis TaxID=204798 RepID=UPI0031DB5A39
MTRPFDDPRADDVSGPLRAADLHDPAGWSRFDTGSPDAAARHFRTALIIAARGEHTSPASNVYYRLGRLSLRHIRTAAHGGASNALPVITTPIEMIGPATVTNASLLRLGLFRIAEVGPTGSLTLTTGVAFTRGNVLGHGGGILNRGAVTLTGSTLTGNTANNCVGSTPAVPNCTG